MSILLIDRDEVAKKLYGNARFVTLEQRKAIDLFLTYLETVGLIKFKPKEPSIIDILRSVHIQLASEIGEKIYGHMTEACAIEILRMLACNDIRLIKGRDSEFNKQIIKMANDLVINGAIVEVSIAQTERMVNIIKLLLAIVDPSSMASISDYAKG